MYFVPLYFSVVEAKIDFPPKISSYADSACQYLS